MLITSPGGAYFYCTLKFLCRNKEDPISAGDVIGFMGDTGYSKEKGQQESFLLKTRLGIYIYKDGKEISVNPYAVKIC